MDKELAGGTYAERVQEAQDETRRAFRGRRKEPVFSLTPKQVEIAQAFVRLINNPDFKVYMQFEANEIASILARAFDPPPDGVLKTTSFGEQMAFNKGRAFQMSYFINERETLVKTFLEMTKTKKEEVQ